MSIVPSSSPSFFKRCLSRICKGERAGIGKGKNRGAYTKFPKKSASITFFFHPQTIVRLLFKEKNSGFSLWVEGRETRKKSVGNIFHSVSFLYYRNLLQCPTTTKIKHVICADDDSLPHLFHNIFLFFSPRTTLSVSFLGGSRYVSALSFSPFFNIKSRGKKFFKRLIGKRRESSMLLKKGVGGSIP